jgi:predicted DNA-binding transcriptional regulator AlpA
MSDQAKSAIQLLDRRTTLKKLGGLAKSTLYEHVATKKLPAPVKIGSRSFWRSDEIEAAIERLSAARG